MVPVASSPAVARAGKVIPNESPWPLRHNRSRLAIAPKKPGRRVRRPLLMFRGCPRRVRYAKIDTSGNPAIPVRTARLPDFSRFFARTVFLDSEGPDYTSRHVDGSRYRVQLGELQKILKVIQRRKEMVLLWVGLYQDATVAWHFRLLMIPRNSINI